MRPDDDDELWAVARAADAARSRLGLARTRDPVRPAALLEGVFVAAQKATGSAVPMNTWLSVVGPRISERAKPGRARDGQLLVETASTAWATELSFLGPDILAKLKAKGYSFQSLRFVVTGQVATQAQKRTIAKRGALPPELEQRLARIDDESLRASIAQAAGFTFGGRPSSKPSSGLKAVPRLAANKPED